ncbi:MAG: LytTR family transcriptional regulator [Bacteroidales bacterium]|nr:LytTR family transcriptional regulator [Bacteroidales bacterium]MBQ2498891.1 LytTR family transcriptional regulator [Bacteroidales bacterium]MBR6092074.1 LytTR family transcriptional regulator [Bacteroidales bacterium]
MDTRKYKLKIFGNKELPSYLLEKNNVVRMILFTTVYSLVFINIFRPFNSETWIPHNSSTNYLMYSSLMVLVGMVVVSLSRVVMGFVVKKVQLTFPDYVLWLVSDAVVLSIFYVFIAYKVGFVDNYINDNPTLTLWEAIFAIFRKSIANTVMMLLIPYTISLLFLDNQYLRGKLKDIGERGPENNTVHLKDEKGEIRLSINIENILYAESADNYVTVKYINSDKIVDFLLRTNLKKLSDDLRDTPIQRCHRSFMINLLHVTSLKKDQTEFVIQFDTTSIKDITVSKSYQDSIMEAFTKYQK